MDTPIGQLFRAAYWPLVIFQVLIRLYAIGFISRKASLSTPTPVGIFGPTLATNRWFQLLYRLRFILALILIIRIIFVLTELSELTLFQGHTIDIIITGSIPFGTPATPQYIQTSIGTASIFIVLVVALILPITAIILDVCLGLAIRTFLRPRAAMIGIIVTIGVVIAVIVFALIIESLLLGVSPQVISDFPQNTILRLIAALFGLGEGDLGLALLNVGPILRLWVDIDYGIFVGVALLVYAAAQAIISNAILRRLHKRL